MKPLLQYVAAGLLTEDIGLPKPSEGSVISGILSTVYFWAGVITVGLVIYGGFMYVISNGDSSKVKKAKDTIVYAIIGLIVVLLAFAITSIVVKGVNGA